MFRKKENYSTGIFIKKEKRCSTLQIALPKEKGILYMQIQQPDFIRCDKQ